MIVELRVDFFFDVWWDLFGVDSQPVDDPAFIVNLALFNYRGFDFLCFCQFEFALFDFVGFSAGDRATCCDDLVHVICWNVDGELAAFFDESMSVAGWTYGYHEDWRFPERSDEAPADRHYVALSSLVRAHEQETRVLQFAERFNGEHVFFCAHTVWWWSVLLKSVSVASALRALPW